MKILYLSCHSILEYDEVKLLHELGHEVFSPGAYISPHRGAADDMRPSIPGLKYNEDIFNKWMKHEAVHPNINGKSYLTKEIVDDFDVILVMHVPDWISQNWQVIKHKKVIWRTIGQSVSSIEQVMAPYKKRGVKIIRYSPQESFIPHFAGQDALIRFYKDENDYGPWNGNKNSVITFCQNMKERGGACNYDLFTQVTHGFSRKLFGPGNNERGLGMGKVSYEQLKQEMRDNRVYFYTGTHPASYTLNFIEAWMSGIPIVAIGPQHGNSDVWRNHNLYEVHNLITNGVNGFVSDNREQLRIHIKNLISDKSLAKEIGENGRKEAIRHFNKEMIKRSWEHFLTEL